MTVSLRGARLGLLFRGLFPMAAVGVLAVAACAPGGSTAPVPGSGPAAPKPATTLRIGTRLETATGLAVFEQTSQREAEWLFHAGLVSDDAQGNLQPRLAAKVPSIADGDWRILPDGRMELTWKLRPGLTWHDGAPLTADDFVFGIEIAKDPDLPLQRQGGVPLIL